MGYEMSRYYLEKHRELMHQEAELWERANELKANLEDINSFLRKKNPKLEEEFSRLYNQLIKQLDHECYRASALATNSVTKFETYHKRYEYSGSNPTLDNAAEEYNRRQRQEEQKAEKEKSEYLREYRNAIFKADNIEHQIRKLLDECPEIKNTILTPYRKKIEEEKRRKEQAKQERLEAEKKKENRNTIIVMSCIILVFLFFVFLPQIVRSCNPV